MAAIAKWLSAHRRLVYGRVQENQFINLIVKSKTGYASQIFIY